MKYIGSGARYIPGIPRHDLSDAELAAVVYRRNGRIRAGDAGFDEALAKLHASLARSGLYAEDAPAPTPKPAPVAAPEPAAPAPTDDVAADAPSADPPDAAPAAEE